MSDPLQQNITMERFEPGDRVVAVNADCSCACMPPNVENPVFDLPDGPLRRDVVYHVEKVVSLVGGGQGLYLTGIRVCWENREISFHWSRFRKVDSLKGYVPQKQEQAIKQPNRKPVCVATRPMTENPAVLG